MQITAQDTDVHVRQPTVSLNTSLGREFYRTAEWAGEGGVTVKVTVIAFVSGIRARRNDDGSVDLLEQVTRFDVMRENEFVQPVERALFLWERQRPEGYPETDVDYSNEVGLFYADTVEAAEEQCRIFLEGLDFQANLNPAAWP